jgi:hypothetical protein
VAEWLSARLVPWVHFVPVREDLDDLAERAQWLADHDAEARKIAQAALRLGEAIARPQHVYCYFAHALHALRRVPVDRARLRDEAAMRRAGYVPTAELWREHGRAAARPSPLRGWLAEVERARGCASDDIPGDDDTRRRRSSTG